MCGYAPGVCVCVCLTWQTGVLLPRWQNMGWTRLSPAKECREEECSEARACCDKLFHSSYPNLSFCSLSLSFFCSVFHFPSPAEPIPHSYLISTAPLFLTSFPLNRTSSSIFLSALFPPISTQYPWRWWFMNFWTQVWYFSSPVFHLAKALSSFSHKPGRTWPPVSKTYLASPFLYNSSR